ncbi:MULTISPECIES: ester cyclase [Pseudofrankia]|uniref:ester cyclase n=1 Tax=Pseudofrankia TaxID=2994363 RepID=UPI000234DB98|nr:MULTISPECIES: nuclear transport factor 2 family protein [Pseudofrankia]OHV40695.1 hypothetical protein BCD49_09255 [Pseudofrankia sp. EUN1h]
MGSDEAGSGRWLVEHYFEMWNSGDTSIASEIIAVDWVDHAHPEVRGPEEVARAIEQIRAARPDLCFTIDSVLGDRDLVAAVGAARGTRLIWLFRVEKGQLTELRTYRDTSS